MNKDLDDRLIPNGEYKDAQNISVGKSEADDIGALETVLGNLIQSPVISPALPHNIKIIGYLSDEYTSSIYIFATTYTDPNPSDQPTYAPSTERCVIYSWQAGSATAKLIADGVFLNFSTTNPVQSSLIENLLFFTDNRNQPRKVNIANESEYYKEESQISVAKYNPYLPISLIKKTTGVVLNQAVTTTTFYVLRNTAIEIGMSVISTSSAGVSKVSSSDYVTVQNVIDASLGGVDMTVVVLSKPITAPAVGDIFTFLISTMTNESSTANWPGDPDYLESRYVRFSYRYRFDDGEYSIMAPFTQIAYIPKQKGYFKNGNEDDAFRSTIVEWMENNVNNIEFLISLPDKANNLGVLPASKYKIESLDILFKESDALAVKVLETVPLTNIQQNSTDNIFTYNYQSRKPYKTLPQAQTTRVFDKVPVRSLSQETAGNRIIYGNFRDTYTSPSFINYDVKVINKGSKFSTSWVEYPNHTLKQNRNYQVGFILADKYGRQSSVILSPVTSDSTEWSDYLGSTLFLPYNNQANQGSIKDWFGQTLQLSITSPIVSGINSYPNFSTGEPGLYAVPTSLNGFAVKQTPATSISDTQYQFTLDNTTYPSNVTVPVEGDYLRGEYEDYVKVINTQPPSSTTASTSSNGGGTGLFLSTLNTNIQVGMVVTGFSGGQGSRVVTQVATPNPNSIIVINQSVNFLSSDVLTFTGSSYTITTDSRVNSIYANNTNLSNSSDTKFAYKINPIGWYSYKVVVKQTEQDYYNVYLPGILNGYPELEAGKPLFPLNEENKTANIVLINDNINKVPRDLAEVGPEQKQFRSSVQLFGRVENTMTTSVASNKQFYPGIKTDTAITIATASDSNMPYGNLKDPEGLANIYQIDTNPLIARLSTSQQIGVEGTTVANTNMTPFLAIYETEPVESLLDIFWETGTVGLIADLNADVNTGFDGPVDFTARNFQLLESNPLAHPITDYFYPVSNEGTAFDSAYPTTATGSYTMVRGGNNVPTPLNIITNGVSSEPTALFTLEQDTDATSSTYKAYRIKTNFLFTYLQDSITQDIFTFTLNITSNNALFVGTEPISFQGSLSNVIPSFVQSTLPTINVTVDETGSIGAGFTAYGQDTKAVNGTNSNNSPTNKESQLKWSIVSGNPTGNDGLPSFELVQSGTNGGNLYQRPNNTPSGQHTLVLKIEDCNGVANVGGLSANLNQIINVGPIATNSGIGQDSCITGPIPAGIGVPVFPALITKRQAVGFITGVWYLAGNTFTSGGTGGYNLSDLPVQPSTAQTGDASQTNTLFRIGTTTLTKGTVVFSLNSGFQWTTPPGPAGLDADVQWMVWHRANSSSTFVAIADINNFTINNSSSGTISSGAIKVDLTTSSTGVLGNFYDQRVLAYNQPGEYVIAAYNAKTVTASVQSEAMSCWVNSNDLYYSTCVIENGVNITGGTARSYQYSIDLTGSTSNYCPNFVSGSSVYSHVPYGQYITQLYSSSNLSSIFNITGSGGVTNYKAFVTTGTSPYYRNSSPQKYVFSSRFSTTTSKVYEPNPATTCYVQACSAQATCTPNIYLYPFSP